MKWADWPAHLVYVNEDYVKLHLNGEKTQTIHLKKNNMCIFASFWFCGKQKINIHTNTIYYIRMFRPRISYYIYSIHSSYVIKPQVWHTYSFDALVDLVLLYDVSLKGLLIFFWENIKALTQFCGWKFI